MRLLAKYVTKCHHETTFLPYINICLTEDYLLFMRLFAKYVTTCHHETTSLSYMWLLAKYVTTCHHETTLISFSNLTFWTWFPRGIYCASQSFPPPSPGNHFFPQHASVGVNPVRRRGVQGEPDGVPVWVWWGAEVSAPQRKFWSFQL